jgi:hypothetical protein
VIFFFSLESQYFISPLTTESLIREQLIFAKNGKSKKPVIITQKKFSDNKSNYTKEISGSSCDDYFIKAMQKFGIKVE